MYIQSAKYETLKVGEKEFEIIELKVRGRQETLEQFHMDIQDMFSLAYDEWTPELGMLTMTFDKVPKEQTLNRVKSYTNRYIEILQENISKSQ